MAAASRRIHMVYVYGSSNSRRMEQGFMTLKGARGHVRKICRTSPYSVPAGGILVEVGKFRIEWDKNSFEEWEWRKEGDHCKRVSWSPDAPADAPIF